jgi:hypothetical protein
MALYGDIYGRSSEKFQRRGVIRRGKINMFAPNQTRGRLRPRTPSQPIHEEYCIIQADFIFLFVGAQFIVPIYTKYMILNFVLQVACDLRFPVAGYVPVRQPNLSMRNTALFKLILSSFL